MAATESLWDAVEALDRLGSSSECGDLARELREMVADVVNGELLPCFWATGALAR